MTTTRLPHAGAADMPRIKPIHLLVMACVGAWSTDGRATTQAVTESTLAQVEFDGAFLQNRLGKHFDVSRFAQRNVTAPGVYTVDIHVGPDWIGRYDVRFAAAGAIALCGLISGYNATEPMALANVRTLLINRVRLQGFIVSDHLSRWPEIIRELSARIASGRLQYRETIAQGLEQAPRAFIGLLKGENFGKQLVHVA